MLLSPPFLPPRPGDLSDAAWLNTLLPDPPAGEGFFPVSRDLNWHGGLHVYAPSRMPLVKCAESLETTGLVICG
ncbi:hypothetical protein [uncultured Herbaspirillum sp.]|jgi:hydroxyethylthiazole kinase|uniref:hypothetical protein n=1 Tax=uncultured Herbaspirillum sp. TaxID=160236 RepID=UPI00261E75AD|nr:hypothetical protein [uncultured Herbaspirillum sp.]